MIKSIELTFNGNFSNGFNVSLRINVQGQGDIWANQTGNLPAAPEIPRLYETWKQLYMALNPERMMIGAPADQPNNGNIPECQRLARELSNRFNQWLSSNELQPVTNYIRGYIANGDGRISDDNEVRVFLTSDDELLHRLPWHSWDLFHNINVSLNVEFCMIPQGGNVIPKKVSPGSRKNTILAVFGDDTNIDVQESRKTILALPNTNVKVLMKPLFEDLHETLRKGWEKEGEKRGGEGEPWDILFFTGHSGNQLDQGVICINEVEPPITIDQLRTALRIAIKRGLKLAIFNSCDGINLAKALLSFHIPQVVVMREPVANHVAERFLKHFLTTFARGKSLYLALHYARGRLEGMEQGFPCASWLPMICQSNASASSYVWKKYHPIDWIADKIRKSMRTILHLPRNIKFFILICLGIGIAFLLYYLWISLPKIPPITERISDGDKFFVNVNSDYKEKELLSTRQGHLVKAFAESKKSKNWNETIIKFKEYLYGTDLNITSDTPLKKNDPEALIYLNNAIAEESGSSNYITIAVSVPIVEKPDHLMGISQEILRGVAMVQNEVNQGNENARLANGKFLKVLIAKDDNAADDKRDVVQAIANNFVANDKILAVVGHNSTKASMAAADIYNKGELKEMTDDKAKEVIQEFKNKKAKALFLIPSIATIEQAGMIAKANYNLDKLPLIANSAMYTDTTIKSKSKKDDDGVKDMVLVTIWHPNINESATSFAKTGKNKEVKFWEGGDVNWRTATSYDAMKVIVEGLRKPSPSRKSLLGFVASKERIKTITGIEGTGENDTISFESKGARNAKVKLIIIKIDGGSFKFDFLRESSNNEKQKN